MGANKSRNHDWACVVKGSCQSLDKIIRIDAFLAKKAISKYFFKSSTHENIEKNITAHFIKLIMWFNVRWKVNDKE